MKVYLNGGFIAAEEARVSALDRGFLFGDGVYEVLRYFDGRPVALTAHVERLARSLREIRIDGFEAGMIAELGEQLLAENRLRDALAYWQVTRGAGPTRAHLPTPGLRPTVMGMAWGAPTLAESRVLQGMSVVLRPDLRWHRCDIKSINLLANVMAKMEAEAEGAGEVILHRDGLVSEGASTNVIVIRDGQAATPQPQRAVSLLRGVTRRCLLEMNLGLAERDVTVEELQGADEILLIGTRTLVASATMLDGAAVGRGVPGPTAKRLLEALVGEIEADIAMRDRERAKACARRG